MARKKTKKEKQKTKQRRLMRLRVEQTTSSGDGVGVASYRLSSETEEVGKSKKAAHKRESDRLVSLLDYDDKLMKKDLMKTVLLSLLVFSVEIGLYVYLR